MKEAKPDQRIALLDRLANAVAPEFHRADGGGSHYYTYAWFHGAACIYVGKGADKRYLDFFVSRDYNSLDAHEYIWRYHNELEPFYVASNLTNTAALAIEYHLIGHFKRRSEGGTLFNEARGHCPGRPGSENKSLSCVRRMAGPAVVPPGTNPLSKQLYARFIEFIDDGDNVIGPPVDAASYWRSNR